MVAAEKAWIAELEKPLPGENSWQTLIRVAEAKDKRLRSKYPRPVPSTQPHPDTIRNTNQQIKMEKARAERQQQARNTPPIQPRKTGPKPAFHQAEDTRRRAEVAATEEAAAERNKG